MHVLCARRGALSWYLATFPPLLDIQPWEHVDPENKEKYLELAWNFFRYLSVGCS
jgi:hypothetical protein